MIPAHLRPTIGHSAHDKLTALRNGWDTTFEYNGHTFTVKTSFRNWTVSLPDGRKCETEGNPESYTDVLCTAHYLLTI